MTAVCETLGVARSNIAERVKQRPSRARGRLPLGDQELMDENKTVIDDMPTYGYRRVHAILRRKARGETRAMASLSRHHHFERSLLFRSEVAGELYIQNIINLQFRDGRCGEAS